MSSLRHLCGLLAAPGNIHGVIAFTAILCIAAGAGASGALNQYYEAELDAKMTRTAKRPLPDGRMEPQAALQFGIGLAAFSVGTMGVAVNWLSAGLLAFSIFFYAVVYTIWLKPNTPQNIVIGGAAGAFPPAIGWAAVTGDITLLPFLALHNHLPMDASAFLVARIVYESRLWRGGHPDAAQCCRAKGNA